MMDKIKSNARDLRRNLTLQERKLWRYLRSRRFGDFKFRRQHPVGSYILDFACCSARVVVELDGGQHDLAVAYDSRRTFPLYDAFKLVRATFSGKDTKG